MLQSVSYIAGALGVCVAAAYYIMSMRTTLQTRQAQLFMPIFAHMYSDSFWSDFRTIMAEWKWKDYDEYMQKYGYLGFKEKGEPLPKIMSYLEGIGVLMKNGLIDPKLLDDQFSSTIIAYWEKYGPLITEWERRTDTPEIAEYTELLYKRVKPIREEQRKRRATLDVGKRGADLSEVADGGLKEILGKASQ